MHHQMAQISYGYNGLFGTKFEIPPSAEMKKNCAEVVSDSFMKEFLDCVPDEALLPTRLKIFGTTYEVGMVLVLDKSNVGQTLKIGLIRRMSFLNEEVTFCCSCFEAEQSYAGYYVATKKMEHLCIVKHSQLYDYCPLQRIGSVNNFVFCLHHFISRK